MDHAADAIARYLEDGGQVSKLQEAIPATAQEVISYLATCGHSARYCEGDSRTYLCDTKRYRASALVKLANTYRQAQGLAPFVLRLSYPFKSGAAR